MFAASCVMGGEGEWEEQRLGGNPVFGGKMDNGAITTGSVETSLKRWYREVVHLQIVEGG